MTSWQCQQANQCSRHAGAAPASDRGRRLAAPFSEWLRVELSFWPNAGQKQHLNKIVLDASVLIAILNDEENENRLLLSFGDRACLACPLKPGAEVFTADRMWAHIDVGSNIHLIR